MGGTNAQLPIGQQVSLPGHLDLPVTLESARPLAKGFECRVRLPDGTRAEAEAKAEAELAGGLKLLLEHKAKELAKSQRKRPRRGRP